MGIQHGIQLLAYVLGKKAQHEVAVLLQQLVLPSIATIRDRIGEVLSAIEFNGYPRVAAQQVDFKCAEAVEWDRRRRTYPGLFPVVHLDHIYYEGHVEVRRVEMPRTGKALIASDHLPVIADLRIGF